MRNVNGGIVAEEGARVERSHHHQKTNQYHLTRFRIERRPQRIPHFARALARSLPVSLVRFQQMFVLGFDLPTRDITSWIENWVDLNVSLLRPEINENNPKTNQTNEVLL